MKKEDKKGELTSQQIVIIVILIASFAILLFFFLMLNLRGETEKEICKNSIAMKNAFSKAALGKVITPKCTTQSVCISMSGDCKQMTSDTVKIKVSSIEETYPKIAELMTDCYWMMGEGKIDLKGILNSGRPCAICSVISFDGKIREEIIAMAPKKGDNTVFVNKLYNYLEENKIPGKEITYLSYLFGYSSIRDFASYYNKIAEKQLYFNMDPSKQHMIFNFFGDPIKKTILAGDLKSYVISGINFIEFNTENIQPVECSYFVTTM